RVDAEHRRRDKDTAQPANGEGAWHPRRFRNAILFAPAPPRAGAAPRPKGSTWGGPFPDTGTTERGHQTPRARRYARRIGAQLQTSAARRFHGSELACP